MQFRYYSDARGFNEIDEDIWEAESPQKTQHRRAKTELLIKLRSPITFSNKLALFINHKFLGMEQQKKEAIDEKAQVYRRANRGYSE
jgi:hypothetical protein